MEQGNRRDRNLEFQRAKENPKFEEKNEKKKLEALKLLEKQEAKDAGEDYERKQFWKYSAESAASWEKKMEKKAKAANNGFTGKFSSLYFFFRLLTKVTFYIDHSQAAHKKYIRLMSEFKPDMSAYSDKKLADIERAIRNGEDPSDISAMANSLDYARLDDKPSKEAVDRLAAETKKQYVDHLFNFLTACLLTLFNPKLESFNVKLDLVIVRKKVTISPGLTKRIVSLTKRLQDFMTSIQRKFAKISKEAQPCKKPFK